MGNGCEESKVGRCEWPKQAGTYVEKVKSLERSVTRLQEQLTSMTSRVDRLEPEIIHINKKLDEVQEEMGRRFDGLSKKLNSLGMQSLTAVCVVIILLAGFGMKVVYGG